MSLLHEVLQPDRSLQERIEEAYSAQITYLVQNPELLSNSTISPPYKALAEEIIATGGDIPPAGEIFSRLDSFIRQYS